MVCNRCKSLVKAELDKLGIHYNTVELGEVTISKKMTSELHTQLFTALQRSGFELIDEQKNELIEKLKKELAQ